MTSSQTTWTDVSDSPRPGRGAAIALGVAFLILGIFAIGFPVIASAAAVVAGVLTVLSPSAGALSLTVVLGLYFAFDGFARLGFAFRAQSRGRRPWLIANGLISLVLSAILVLGLPGTSLYAIGLLFGVHALFAAAMLFAAAFASSAGSEAA